MRAGVYQTPNGNLVYVAKDRTVKATTLSLSSWPGTKVKHRSSDDTVLLDDVYRCERYCDVPNGCTEPNVFLDGVKAGRADEPLASDACDYFKKAYIQGHDIGSLVQSYREGPGKKIADVWSNEGEPEALPCKQTSYRTIPTSNPFKETNTVPASGGYPDSHSKELFGERGNEETRRLADVPRKLVYYPTLMGDAFEAMKHIDEAFKPEPGDIVIAFEDCGQDFLTWVVRDDTASPPLTKVVACGPYQHRRWVGTIVHNAGNLVAERADKAFITDCGFDDREIEYKVKRAMQVVGEQKVYSTIPASNPFKTIPDPYRQATTRARRLPSTKSDVLPGGNAKTGGEDSLNAVRAVLKHHGWRHCHAKAARKHRKQGHQVVALHEPGQYAWRPS